MHQDIKVGDLVRFRKGSLPDVGLDEVGLVIDLCWCQEASGLRQDYPAAEVQWVGKPVPIVEDLLYMEKVDEA